MSPLALIALAVGEFACGVLFAGNYCYRRGIRRGRELERMEPPLNGAFHFRDGCIIPIYADSASQAVDRLQLLRFRPRSGSAQVGEP